MIAKERIIMPPKIYKGRAQGHDDYILAYAEIWDQYGEKFILTYETAIAGNPYQLIHAEWRAGIINKKGYRRVELATLPDVWRQAFEAEIRASEQEAQHV